MAKVKALTIRSLAPTGHRRGGRRWGREAVTVAVAELGKDALAAIRADARLVVEETEVDGPEPAGAKDGAKDGAKGEAKGGKS